MTCSRAVRRTVLLFVFILCVAAAAVAQTPPAEPQGKVITVSGTVQHTVASREAWSPAAVFQPLFVSERVRTLTASRAAILFIDETQVKLNAGAVLMEGSK